MTLPKLDYSKLVPATGMSRTASADDYWSEVKTISEKVEATDSGARNSFVNEAVMASSWIQEKSKEVLEQTKHPDSYAESKDVKRLAASEDAGGGGLSSEAQAKAYLAMVDDVWGMLAGAPEKNKDPHMARRAGFSSGSEDVIWTHNKGCTKPTDTFWFGSDLGWDGIECETCGAQLYIGLKEGDGEGDETKASVQRRIINRRASEGIEKPDEFSGLKQELRQALLLGAMNPNYNKHDKKADEIYEQLSQAGRLDIYTEIHKEMSSKSGSKAPGFSKKSEDDMEPQPQEEPPAPVEQVGAGMKKVKIGMFGAYPQTVLPDYQGAAYVDIEEGLSPDEEDDAISDAMQELGEKENEGESWQTYYASETDMKGLLEQLQKDWG